MILAPKRATWQRWQRLADGQYSLLRSLEYEAIEALTLHGRTLDLGGGRVADYHSRLRIDGALESLNIGVSLQPSICADANVSWPLQSDTYDNFISLNTFEHLQNDVNALREAIRVLKPGGQFHTIVPFLYRVHGSPSDYHRHTGYWWRDTLLAYGLSNKGLVIEPLVWDPFSSGYSLVEFNFRWLRGITKRLIMLLGVARQAGWPGDRLPEIRATGYGDFALGYYIRGVKAGGAGGE